MVLHVSLFRFPCSAFPAAVLFIIVSDIRTETLTFHSYFSTILSSGESMSITHLSAFDYFQHTNQNIEVIYRNPQVPYPLHTHDFAELVIIRSGTGIHFTRGASYQVSAGDVFLIEKGFAHGYRNPQGLLLYNILFDEDLLKQNIIDIREMPGYHAIFHLEPAYRHEYGFRHRLRLQKPQLDAVCALAESMSQELKQKNTGHGSRALGYALFIELIVTLSRMYVSGESGHNRVIHRLARVFTYMEQHITSSLSLEELIEISGMSASTLTRAFKRSTGLSPISYHLRMRIDRARTLLQDTQLTITDIAYELGFNDSNYFTRQFRKIVGIPPRMYRKRTQAPVS